ncbi:hypothetical protein BV20DRAFT_19285 [Pilatotrama ljubarskyi]|nr:hypothetical protein BV20DRAFT_19285 [Pilatotrama ljubarskyi]
MVHIWRTGKGKLSHLCMHPCDSTAIATYQRPARRCDRFVLALPFEVMWLAYTPALTKRFS